MARRLLMAVNRGEEDKEEKERKETQRPRNSQLFKAWVGDAGPEYSS
jgi:hypothetical protein